MLTLLKVIIGIGFCVLGGTIGLRILLYSSVGGLGIYAAVAFNRAYYYALSFRLQAFMRPVNAGVVSVLVLSLVPFFLVTYFGRRLILFLKITGKIARVIDSTLGAAFLCGVYIVILSRL